MTDGNCTTSLVVVLLSQKYEGGQESTVNVLTEWSTTLEDSKNLLTVRKKEELLLVIKFYFVACFVVLKFCYFVIKLCTILEP